MSRESDPRAAACEALCSVYDDVDDATAELRERESVESTDDRRTVFAALANDHRLRMLGALRGGELCVCELQYLLEAPQSTVATHLSTLREAGLVKTRKKGRWTYYRIADTAILEVLDLAAAIDVPDA